MGWVKKLLGMPDNTKPAPSPPRAIRTTPELKRQQMRKIKSVADVQARANVRYNYEDERRKNADLLKKLKGLQNQLAQDKVDWEGFADDVEKLNAPTAEEIEQAKQDLLSAAEELS